MYILNDVAADGDREVLEGRRAVCAKQIHNTNNNDNNNITNHNHDNQHSNYNDNNHNNKHNNHNNDTNNNRLHRCGPGSCGSAPARARCHPAGWCQRRLYIHIYIYIYIYI